VQLIKLLQTHIVPSDKQIEKLDSISDFYFDYYNKIENLWYDYNNDRLSDEDAQEKYYEIKSTEKEINKIVKDIIKSVNKSAANKADLETKSYLTRTFNV